MSESKMSKEEVKIVARLVGVTRSHVVLDLLVEDLEVGFAPNVKPGPLFGEKVLVTILRSGIPDEAPRVVNMIKHEPKPPAAAPPPSGGK